MIEIEVKIPQKNLNENRMKLLSLACGYKSEVILCNNDARINAKSIMRIPEVEADVCYKMEIDGVDELDLVDRMQQMISSFD